MMMKSLKLVVAVMAAASSTSAALKKGIKCPAVGGWGPHASMRVVAIATASCEHVSEEIQARSIGYEGWIDPHNAGKYTLMNSSSTVIETNRTTNPKVSVGGQTYTDRQTFTLKDENGNCRIEACSVSESTSVNDYSTNYCNLRNLYCGAVDGCKPIIRDFFVTETVVHASLGAGKDKIQCTSSTHLHEEKQHHHLLVI